MEKKISTGKLGLTFTGCFLGAGYVSGRHARFQLMGQNLFVEDLGSTNGTAVNGQRISAPTALRNKDVVNIGDVNSRVRYM